MQAEHLGTRVRQAREMAGLTQGQVAEALGVTKQAISRLETVERSDYGVHQVEKIAKTLGCSVDFLIGKGKK